MILGFFITLVVMLWLFVCWVVWQTWGWLVLLMLWGTFVAAFSLGVAITRKWYGVDDSPPREVQVARWH